MFPRASVSSIITVAVFVIAFALIYGEISRGLGAILLVYGIIRVVSSITAARLLISGQLLDAVSESRSAVHIRIAFNVESVLKYTAINELYTRLKGAKSIPESISLESWRNELIESARGNLKFEEDAWPWTSVVFEIRSGQIWKDGEYKSWPVIAHEVFIPNARLGGLRLASDRGLKIRVVVMNGELRLQVGEWNKEDGYAEEGQKYSWMSWDTITSFPLFLNPIDHYIPPRLLLLQYFMYPKHRADWAQKKREFFRRVNEYRRVLGTFGEYGEEELYKRQKRDFDKWIKDQNFEEMDYFRGWSNEYLSVRFHVSEADHDAYRYFSSESEERYI